MIEIKNLGKTFGSKNGDIIALKNINLTVNDGEIFGIIGLSGAGKSTLVRCMNLLEKPTEGEVIVDGNDLMKLSRSELLETRRSIDLNHQMAGKTLHFTGEIISVREATEKELKEGLHGEYVHSCGCGGCHGHEGGCGESCR